MSCDSILHDVCGVCNLLKGRENSRVPYKECFSYGVDADKCSLVDNGGKLDFCGNSDDLDDQLAEIYDLTDEERSLMKSSIRQWKDKNSISGDSFF